MQYAYSCTDRELLLVDSVESAAVEVLESAESCWRFTHNRKTSTESYPGDKWTSLCSCWEWFAAISSRKSLSVKVDDLWGWLLWFNIHPFRWKKDHVIGVKDQQQFTLFNVKLNLTIFEKPHCISLGICKAHFLGGLFKSLLFSFVCSISNSWTGAMRLTSNQQYSNQL